MPASKAARLCPEAIFVRPDFSKYREASDRIREIFESVTTRVEPLSLDEAYLDVTVNALGEASAGRIAQSIRTRIRQETGLSASAGVGANKFIAKLASDLRKPDGLVVVPPERMLDFIARLPVERLWGVGPATAARLREVGLRTIGEVRSASPSEMERLLGSFGAFLHGLSRGEDHREVESGGETKSRGTETTFGEDVYDVEELRRWVTRQSEEVVDELDRIDRSARTVTVKLKYADFTSITRGRTLPQPTRDAGLVAETARELVTLRTEAGRQPVRLIGVSLSGITAPTISEQLRFEFERGVGRRSREP